MLSRAQSNTRIGGEFTVACAHRACSLGNVARRYGVRVVLKAALSTAKEALRASVGFLAMLAPWADARGVARINRYHRDPSKCGLVLKHLSKEGVRPHVVLVPPCPAPPSEAGTLSEVGQILDGDGVAGYERIHDPAGDGVQRVADEATFSTTEPIPEFLESSGAFGIELTSDLASLGSVVEPLGLHRPAGVVISGRECGDGGLPYVHTYRFPPCRRALPAGYFRDFGTDGDVNVPLVVGVLGLDQVPTLNAGGVREQMPLVVADGERDALPATNGSEAHRLAFERERALIIGYRAILEAVRLLALSLGNTTYGLYREVRGEAVVCAESVVTEMVEAKSPPLCVLSRYLERVVTGIGKGRERTLQRLCLTRRGLELALYRKYGVHEYHSIPRVAGKRRIFLSPRDRRAVSNPATL